MISSGSLEDLISGAIASLSNVVASDVSNRLEILPP